MSIGTIVFDVNQTLFSLDAVRSRARKAGLDDGSFEAWFAKVLRDGFALAATGGCEAFPDIAEHHLREALRQRGEGGDDELVSDVIGGFREVEPHPDLAPAVEALRRRDVRLAALTNGTAEIASQFLERAGLREAFAAVLDVREAGRWKPHAEAYAHVLRRLAADAAETALVAVHPWDVHGARRAGLGEAVWVRRDPRREYPSYFEPPTSRIAALTELPGALALG